MIPKVNSGSSFSALGDYLTTGRDGSHSERVAWASTRNLSTEDAKTAAAIMESTAAQNARTRDPVYHISLSFHPSDVVDRQIIESAANRVLKDLRLEGHQALFIAHNDRDHPHVHIMVNRVHPETLRAWSRWQDYPTIEGTLRAIERDHDLHRVDGYPRRRDPQPGPEHAPTERPATQTRPEATRIPPTAVETHPATHAAREYLAARSRADTADRATADADAARAHVDQWERAKSRAQHAVLRFETALDKIYVDPAQAARRILAHADKPGPSSAFDELRDRPGTYGALRPDSPVSEWAAGRSRSEAPARALTTESAARGAEAHAAIQSVHRIAKAHGIDHLSLTDVSAMLQARAHAIADHAAAARTARDAGPSVSQTRQTLRAAARGADAVLGTTLSATDWAIVKPVLHKVRSALLGHEEHAR